MTILPPDCAMKHLPRAAAFAMVEALVATAHLVRGELAHQLA